MNLLNVAQNINTGKCLLSSQASSLNDKTSFIKSMTYLERFFVPKNGSML